MSLRKQKGIFVEKVYCKEGFLTNVVFVTGKTNDVATAKSVQARTATEWTTRSSWDNTQWGKSWWLRKRGKTSSRSQSSWKAGVSFHYQFDSNSILFLQRDSDRNSRWHIHLTVFKSVYCSFQASKRGFKNASATRCLKITEKVSFKIGSEASYFYFYILNGQKLIRNAENGLFWLIFENLKVAVKQCYQTGHL